MFFVFLYDKMGADYTHKCNILKKHFDPLNIIGET